MCELNLPLAHKELLFQRPGWKSHLNVLDICDLLILHQQSDYEFLEVISSQETRVFSEFSSC